MQKGFLEIMIENDKRDMSINFEDIENFSHISRYEYKMSVGAAGTRDYRLKINDLLIKIEKSDKSSLAYKAFKERTPLFLRIYTMNDEKIKTIEEFGNARISGLRIDEKLDPDFFNLEISYKNFLMGVMSENSLIITHKLISE